MYKSLLNVLETSTCRTSRPLLLSQLWLTKDKEGKDMQSHLNEMAAIRLKLL